MKDLELAKLVQQYAHFINQQLRLTAPEVERSSMSSFDREWENDVVLEFGNLRWSDERRGQFDLVEVVC